MDSREIFLDDVVRGLTTLPRSIPGKYLWDEEGSRLFEAITRTADYYHTAAEHALTREALPNIAALLGPGPSIVEFGSGSSRKTRQMLDSLDTPSRYIGLDISREFLEASIAQLAAAYPRITFRTVHADYSKPLPHLPIDRAGQVLGFVLGTSVGNMVPGDAQKLLERFKEALAPGFLLIGQDINRDPVRLRNAYEGPLMTALHKNILVRLKTELGAKVDVDAFRHESRTFDIHVEPHLVALKHTQIEIAGHTIGLRANESIRTDLSWKYSIDDFSCLAAAAGWYVETVQSDRDGRYALFLLRAD